MEFSSPPPSLVLSLLLIASAAATSAANSHESEDMLQSLRNYGYTLFANGISTSELKYQLLSDSLAAAAAAEPTLNFTVFAPRDELLYALDMAADAAVYVSTLRYHVVPNRRHTFADLKNLTVPFLDTLLPHYAVLIGKVRDIDVSNDRPSIAVVVDGVRVTFPDLYVGSGIAVHGIDGILLTGLNMSQDLISENDHYPPAQSPVTTNNPAGNHASTTIQFNRNNNAPALGTTSISVAPASSEGNVPAEGTLNPNAQTQALSNVSGEIPTERNDDAAPPANGILTAPVSQIDWNKVTAAPAVGGPTTPTSRLDRSDNISAGAAPKIPQDQTENMNRLGGKRKQNGKSQLKERRRHHHHRPGRRRLCDI